MLRRPWLMKEAVKEQQAQAKHEITYARHYIKYSMA